MLLDVSQHAVASSDGLYRIVDGSDPGNRPGRCNLRLYEAGSQMSHMIRYSGGLMQRAGAPVRAR